MDAWLRFADRIDRFNERAGRIVLWCTVIMVGVGAFNTVVRYLGQYLGTSLSSNFYIEAQWYLFSLVFLLGAAYTLRHDRHVRADVIYGRLSAKARAWIDFLGTVLFLIPFSVLMLWVTWPAVRRSWAIFETSPDPGGLPRYPIKTVVLLAFVLIIVQGVAIAIRKWAIIRGVIEPEASEEDEDGPSLEQIEGV